MENTNNNKEAAQSDNTGAASSVSVKSVPKKAKFEITLEDGEVIYLKEINRATLGIVLGLIMPSSGNPDYIRAGEIIINTCALKDEGDLEAVKANDMLFVAACFQAYQIIELKTGKIKKL